jgi:hypothetical protein
MRPSTNLCQSRPALKRRINVNEIIQILEGATPWTRPRSQAGDCADARSRHRQPFAGRDAGAKVAAKEVYAALDWLGREQPFIEATLARRHLKNGALLALRRHLDLSRWRGMVTAATTVATGRSLSSA